jgi:hypothetical protein
MHTGHATLQVSPLLVDCCGEQEVSDGVAPWRARFRRESKAQEISRGRLSVREGNETIPKVAHRWDPELLAQHP